MRYSPELIDTGPRRSVGELCEEPGPGFQMGTVTPDELRDADEVFLTSTAGGVNPVSRVNERIFGNGHPGPITLRLREHYWNKHEQGWHATPVHY